jgi:hypothetical protein
VLSNGAHLAAGDMVAAALCAARDGVHLDRRVYWSVFIHSRHQRSFSTKRIAQRWLLTVAGWWLPASPRWPGLLVVDEV